MATKSQAAAKSESIAEIEALADKVLARVQERVAGLRAKQLVEKRAEELAEEALEEMACIELDSLNERVLATNKVLEERLERMEAKLGGD